MTSKGETIQLAIVCRRKGNNPRHIVVGGEKLCKRKVNFDLGDIHVRHYKTMETLLSNEVVCPDCHKEAKPQDGDLRDGQIDVEL